MSFDLARIRKRQRILYVFFKSIFRSAGLQFCSSQRVHHALILMNLVRKLRSSVITSRSKWAVHLWLVLHNYSSIYSSDLSSHLFKDFDHVWLLSFQHYWLVFFSSRIITVNISTNELLAFRFHDNLFRQASAVSKLFFETVLLPF